MPFKLLLQLSLRNLMRHRRRNAMLLAAISVAVAAVVLMNSLIRGMQADMIGAAIDGLVGHLKIHAPGYRDDPGIARSFALEAGWQPPETATPVAGWAGRVRVPAVIMSERRTRGIQLVGVDPSAEDISFLGRVAVAGASLTDAADGRILMGRALADALQTQVGRRVVIITQGMDERARESGFHIAGVFDAEGEGLEKAFVFTGVQALQTLVGAEVFTEVSIKLDQEAPLTPIKDALRVQTTDLEVLDWQELEPQAAAMAVYADAAIFIWFLVMMGALIFGLVNALVTSVMERVRELGMLRALGMRKLTVIVQVVLESSLMMCFGVMIGLLLGASGIYLLADGIDLARWAEGVEAVGMKAVLQPVPRLADVLLVVSLSLALGVVASLWPAWRVVKIKPLEALRR